jgi:AraC-like DNA-binding protein
MIGKTRQVRVTKSGRAVSIAKGVGPARGLLRDIDGPGNLFHARIAAPMRLRGLIEHFWIVRWTLPDGAMQVQESLPHPNVHVVVEEGEAHITGPHTARFVRELKGSSGVFGIKFTAGGFYPFYGKPIATLANRTIPLSNLFSDADAFAREIQSCKSDRTRMRIAVRYFERHRPTHDATVEQARTIVASIAGDREIISVAELAARSGLNVRALQRLFKQYVGVSPKWVINRYRLHEAVERLKAGKTVDWTQTALELGYFDQAHFIRDFKKLVGKTPAEFSKGARKATG